MLPPQREFRLVLLPSVLAATFVVPFSACSPVTTGSEGEGGGGGFPSSHASGGGGAQEGDSGGSGVAGSGAGVSQDTIVVEFEEQEAPATCGDGVLDETEACDDGNLSSGDGCFENCLIVEPAFICPQPGEPCRPYAKCGDGRTTFPEQCDDENQMAGDGCSEFCKMEIGSDCAGEPSACFATTCGDGSAEGAEGCDDGNSLPFDGCDSSCQWEPSCGEPGAAVGCSSFCGDGILLGDEECDDGNSIPGDGCSDECQEEEGYSCATAPCEERDGECILRVPAIFHDFNAVGSDFEVGCGGFEATPGLIESELDDEGKPVLVGDSGPCIQSAASFSDWYRSTDENSTIVSEVVLFSNGADGFVNRFGESGAQYENAEGVLLDGTPLFFPVDDFADCAPDESLQCALLDTRVTAELPGEGTYEMNWTPEPGGALHNFSYTSHVSYWFQYDAAAPATLNFLGDDDTWVFINGKLAVDLGGPHTPLEAEITLDAPTVESLGLGLLDGNVYPISVFHAERRAKGSSFRLTLSGFRAERSLCLPDCGDGIVAGNEECDDGDNDGGQNECQPGCVLAGYCGDGIVQEGESCDDADPEAPANCSGCRLVVVIK